MRKTKKEKKKNQEKRKKKKRTKKKEKKQIVFAKSTQIFPKSFPQEIKTKTQIDAMRSWCQREYNKGELFWPMERLYRRGKKTDWKRLMTFEERRLVDQRCREFHLDHLFFPAALTSPEDVPRQLLDGLASHVDHAQVEEREEEEEEAATKEKVSHVQISAFVFGCFSPSGSTDSDDADDAAEEEKAAKKEKKERKRKWWSGRGRKSPAHARRYVSGRGSSSDSD